MFVNPDIAFSVDLSERVEVQLPNQGLESIVSKILWQGFRLQPIQVRPNDKGVSGWRPLLKISQEKRSREEDIQKECACVSDMMYVCAKTRIESRMIRG